MPFRDIASRALALLFWFGDGLLWAILVFSAVDTRIFLRGGTWVFVLLTALILPIPAAALWRAAHNRNTYVGR